MSSNEDTKNISAVIILEIIGRPPEHLTETLNNLVKDIDKEERVNVKEKKINEPRPMEENKDFYTSFAEIEIEIKEIMDLAMIIFKYMPAHVDIIYPEAIALTNNSWNEIFNELARRLHGYDEIARVLQVENAKMQKKLKESGINIGEKEEGKKNISSNK